MIEFVQELNMKVPPSFFVLVLKALLIIGGVESNPGPVDKVNCELCGSLLEEALKNLKNDELAASVKAKLLQEYKEKVYEFENEIEMKDKLLQKKMEFVTQREAMLIEKEKLLRERENLHIQTERAFMKCGVSSACAGSIRKVQMATKLDATPENFHKAVCEGNWSGVRHILQTGKLPVEYRFADRKTPLLLASETGHLSLVQYLIEEGGACVNATDNLKGRTALHWAAYGGHRDVLIYLVTEANMNPSEKTALSETALHIAAEGGFVDVIRFLVGNAGVGIHDKDSKGMCAAHFAAKRGHLHVVKYLWEKCDKTPFGTTNDGWTPLHFACEAGHLDVVMYLVKSGAVNKSTLNRAGYTAVAYAPKSNSAIKTFLS
ncbi:espin-like [Anabrus simplex]|uniref:espin-like n=1 Tax=Anabrus simplex TaxID=316456 RepID=UPI0035A2AAE9